MKSHYNFGRFQKLSIFCALREYIEKENLETFVGKQHILWAIQVCSGNSRWESFNEEIMEDGLRLRWNWIICQKAECKWWIMYWDFLAVKERRITAGTGDHMHSRHSDRFHMNLKEIMIIIEARVDCGEWLEKQTSRGISNCCLNICSSNYSGPHRRAWKWDSRTH